MSFIKLAESATTNGNGRGSLHFHRAHIDGVPFRGSAVPPLKDHEWDQYTEVVRDADLAVFEATNAEDKEKLQTVIDKVANGVCRMLRFDHHWYTREDGTPGLKIFVMWCTQQRELAKYRMPNNLLGLG